MARKGYYHRMFRHGIDVLNDAAQDVAAFEEYEITLHFPAAPGVGRRQIKVEGYFDENPSPYRFPATGLRAALNGVLFVRENQTPEELTALHHAGIPANMEFHVRGRKYVCMRADYARGEYAFLLSDLNEYPK